jgi:methanogenic corrinoid protein MtbC1
MLSNETKSTIAEMVKILEPLDEADKRQALALIQGMIIGKELAEQKTA